MVAFGTNEWLVDEIYQQYLKDPQSVDRAWWDFFADYRPGDASTLPGPTAGTVPDADAAAASRPIGAPLIVVESPAPPRPAPTTGLAPSDDAPRRRQPAPAGHPRARARGHARAGAQRAGLRGRGPRVGDGPGRPAGGPVLDPHRPHRRGRVDPAPRVLRGPSARVVVNMEASLEVPTATSVRALPAKLLIDNRHIINNQLARGRGGKVSFTHLIGYAVVRALSDMPEMNVGFTRVDGKPAVIAAPGGQPRPGDRHRQAGRDPPAARAVHQGRRAGGLRGVLGQLRGAGPQGAHRGPERRRLRRDHRDPDQPRHDRHRQLGARASCPARA